MTALLIGPAEMAALAELRTLAAANPVDVHSLAVGLLSTPQGREWHRAHMTRQSLELPGGYLVTFSIEHGHPCGTARHMSISSPEATAGFVPGPAAVWLVAEALGFRNGLAECLVYPEALLGHGHAANVVQPMEPEP